MRTFTHFPQGDPLATATVGVRPKGRNAAAEIEEAAACATLERASLREDCYYAAALAWAGEFGYEGDELPRGIGGSVERCPLAVATGMDISSDRASLLRDGEWTHFALPLQVQNFVRRFDVGLYPELEAAEVAV